jgi:hypothetical protein
MDNLTSARVAGSWFGLGILHLKYPKTSDFNTIALAQSFSHGFKKGIYHLHGHSFFASCVLGHAMG